MLRGLFGEQRGERVEGGRSGSEVTAQVLAGPPLGSPVADLAELSLLVGLVPALQNGKQGTWCYWQVLTIIPLWETSVAL